MRTRDVKQLLKGSVVLVALAALGAGGAVARAEAGPPPDDGELARAATVGVLPVLMPGPSRQAGYASLAATWSRGQAGQAVGAPGEFVTVDGPGGGFAFAGQAGAGDVQIMKYAFLLGATLTQASNPERLAEMVKTLTDGREVLAPLSPAVVKAVDAFLASAKAGDIRAAALAEALMAAEEGIAAGPARAHGYFAAGVWLGTAMTAAGIDGLDPAFAAMAAPLAVMLEEDAQFGGADRKLAAVLRDVAQTFAAGKPDPTAFRAALSKVVDVTADVAPTGDGDAGDGVE